MRGKLTVISLIQPYSLAMILCLVSSSLLSSDDFEKNSLALRTALHYDPSVEVPLTKLIELYRNEGRVEELLGLYGAHLTQYPQDVPGKLVLARLYVELKDRRAAEFLKASVAQHPDSALLAWQQARLMRDLFDPKAVEEMARAVSLEKSPARRAQWFGELLKTAAMQSREDLVLTQTKRLLEESAMTSEQRLRWARQALNARLARTAEALLTGLKPESFTADSAVEAGLLQAEIAAAQGRNEEATKSLDELLSRLAPDYWRRREILRLRLDLAGGTGEREALVEAARSKWSQADGKTEAQALTLVDVLLAAQRSSEALVILREASNLLSESSSLEALLLDVWEQNGLNAEAVSWLQARLKNKPDHLELRLREVRWLFSRNDSKSALQVFEALRLRLPELQQRERSVEMGRWLRRHNHLSEAATILETALKAAPERWELRRELAELCFAQRRKDEAVKLFQGDWSRELTADARLEMVQFLMSKQLWLESRQLLEPLWQQQPGAFEGQLLLARILEKLGENPEAEAVYLRARSSCDTESRYQGWLEAALDHADTLEQGEIWMESEANRLLTESEKNGTGGSFPRWRALLEQVLARDVPTLAETLLARVQTLKGLTMEQGLSVEKLKLDLLATSPLRSADVEKGLRELMEKDATHKEDYRLRLILFYRQAQRQDLAYEMMQELEPALCSEVAGLRGVLPVCVERGLTIKALACAERLAKLEPAERSHWAQWLDLLAQEGQDDKLRVSLHEVMSKAHDWKLKPEVLEQLQMHLVASHWRSVLAELSGGEQRWAAARRAAAELGSLQLTPEQQRWMDWISGYLSLKLEDRPAVQSALAKLDKLDARQWITFPDGLELSVKQAGETLRSEPQKTSAAPVNSSGPVPGFAMSWGFALEGGRILTKVLASPDEKLVFLCDNRQTLSALEVSSGKLRWSQSAGSGGKPASLSTNSRMNPRSSGGMSMRYGQEQPNIVMPVQMASDAGRFCYLAGNLVCCLEATTGELLWQSDLGSAEALITQANAQNRIGFSQNRVVVWQPGSAMVSALHGQTGKLLWQTDVPQPPAAPMNPNYGYGGYDTYSKLKSGMTLEGDRVFVFSRTAAMLHLHDGAVRWRLAAGEVPGFPLDLQSESEETSGFAMVPNAPQRMMPLRSARGTIYAHGTQGRGGNATTRRWAYGNPIRVGLDSFYAGMAVTRGDEVWTMGTNGLSMVSRLGLPVAQLNLGGTMVGFAGSSLVTYSGNMISLTKAKSDEPAGAMLFPDWAASSGVEATPESVSVAVLGQRVYATDLKRLRAVDVRSGAVTFDVAVPAELASWVAARQKIHTTSVKVTYTGYPSRMQPQRRSYLPQGTFMQDERGGGILCENRALVTSDSWLIPVGESALACVSGVLPVSVPPSPTPISP